MDIDKRRKKITIRHFLNKKLKAERFDKKIYYPSYTRISFNRKNTIFSMNWVGHFDIDERYMMFPNKFTNQLFESFLTETPTANHVINMNKLIEQIIRFEVELLGDDFTLTGFKNRLDFYLTSLPKALYDLVTSLVFNKIKSKLDKKTYYKIRKSYYQLNLNNFSYKIDNDKFTINSLLVPDFELVSHLKGDNKEGDTVFLLASLILCDELFTSSLGYVSVSDWVLDKQAKKLILSRIKKMSEHNHSLHKELVECIELFVSSNLDNLYL